MPYVSPVDTIAGLLAKRYEITAHVCIANPIIPAPVSVDTPSVFLKVIKIHPLSR